MRKLALWFYLAGCVALSACPFSTDDANPADDDTAADDDVTGDDDEAGDDDVPDDDTGDDDVPDDDTGDDDVPDDDTGDDDAPDDDAPDDDSGDDDSGDDDTPASCSGLDYCGCLLDADCQVMTDSCICPCDYACEGFEDCVCGCGGGEYLGCEPAGGTADDDVPGDDDDADPCADLGVCACMDTAGCGIEAEACFCPSEHGCPGYETISCFCGGGAFLGCHSE